VPRKPSSIFVITGQSQRDALTGATYPTAYQVVRVRLDGRTVEQAAEEQLAAAQPGTEVWIAEDTKATMYRADVKLTEVDDPRLPDPATPGENGPNI
jgi:hypothetical protein